ncbi:MAG: hypothetical protein J5I93_30445 [Pirellulaceae bacterium]|nr:hypothetical protein [Pirellulaceae bacterium]
MNKAFVREAEFDGRAYCPRCGTLGTAVNQATLDQQIQAGFRRQIGESAWFCSHPTCDIVYFDLLERTVATDQLRGPVYPKDPAAPVCACFGFTLDDIDADLGEAAPVRIRQLLDRSRTDEARCRLLAADGRCCVPEVQRLYMKGLAARKR